MRQMEVILDLQCTERQKETKDHVDTAVLDVATIRILREMKAKETHALYLDSFLSL